MRYQLSNFNPKTPFSRMQFEVPFVAWGLIDTDHEVGRFGATEAAS